MLFNSYIFVFLFLPLCVAVYYLLYRLGAGKLPQLWLLGMSLWFYGYFNPYYLIIICSSIICNYLISRVIISRLDKDAQKAAKAVTALGVLINIGVLFYFKYVDFFISNINAVFGVDYPLRHILLPLGISFFTFQQISFVVDSQNGETRDYSFLEYAVFVAFFPQLVAGPIVLHDELIPQFRDPALHKPDMDRMARGFWMFSVGMFKKVILADTLSVLVEAGFAGSDILSTVDVILVLSAYAFQLYFDFSGYSDMASGIAGLFSLTLPINFNSPLNSASMIEFWGKWHMTLTRFLTKYVYFPLGGSRKGKARALINLLLVYVISGFWHGAGWTYIAWGLATGVLIILNKTFKRSWDRVPKPLATICTFFAFCFTLAFFRSADMGQAIVLIRKVVKLESFAISPAFLECLALPEVLFIERLLHINGLLGGRFGLHLWGFIALCCYIVFFRKNIQTGEFKPTASKMVGGALMLTLCIMCFSGLSTFLYFNF